MIRRLIDVYAANESAGYLFRLLKERNGRHDVNISHRRVPSWEKHIEFVRSKPYAAWYLIEVSEAVTAPWPIDPPLPSPVGAIYLSKTNEIGIHISQNSQGRGHGPWAIHELMRLHPRDQYLGNVNPKNARSLAMFAKLGFVVKQITMSKESGNAPDPE